MQTFLAKQGSPTFGGATFAFLAKQESSLQ